MQMALKSADLLTCFISVANTRSITSLRNPAPAHLLHICGQHQINHIPAQPIPCSPASYLWPTPDQSHPCAAQPSSANRESSSIQSAGTGLSNARMLLTMDALYHTGRQYRVQSERHTGCQAGRLLRAVVTSYLFAKLAHEGVAFVVHEGECRCDMVVLLHRGKTEGQLLR